MFFFLRQRVLAPWFSVKNKVKISEVKRGQYSEVKSHYGQIMSESWPLGGIKRYFIVYFKCVFGFQRLNVY